MVGLRLDHPAILDLLQHYPSPAAMRAAGVKRLGIRLLKNPPCKGRVRAAEIAIEVEKPVEQHPLQPVLMSMPGVGIRAATRLLADVTTKRFQPL